MNKIHINNFKFYTTAYLRYVERIFQGHKGLLLEEYY